MPRWTVMLLLAACTQPPVVAPPVAPARAPEAVGAPRVEAETYAVTLAPVGPYPPTSAGEVIVSIEARAGYHVNADYPVKFTTAKDATVTFASPAIPLRDVLHKTPCEKQPTEACAASAKVPFTAGAAGDAVVAGTLAFSVCSAEQCLIEKVPLRLTLSVR
ncbi:MAG: hypothetical protein JNG84_01875 [Archangium sp.]|nr:hypothetical protein [Archangium sp.]